MGIATQLLATADLRANSTITITEVAALKKRWNPRNVEKRRIHVGDEYDILQQMLPMRVSDEQSAAGLQWLRTLMFTKKGQPRDTKLMREQVTWDHFGILADFHYFEFNGFYWREAPNGWEWPFPIYVVVSKDERHFEYAAVPWQSGEPVFSAVGSGL